MVKETLVDIQTPDGLMAAYCYEPDTKPRGIAIMYMDGVGIRSTLRDMARRLCGNHYLAILPDLYHREARLVHFDSARSLVDEVYRNDVIRHIRSVTNAFAMTDTKSCLEWADGSYAGDLKVGTVGYCMGGPFAFLSASRFSDRVVAAASFFGVGCMSDRPDSPHLGIPKIKAELYFGYAEKDHLAPVSEIDKLKKMLDDAHIENAAELYAGVDHGFAFADRNTYDKAATDRHWEQLLQLFHRRLG